MLGKLWQKLSRGKTSNRDHSLVLTRDQHNVSRKKMSRNALKVLHRLNAAGYQAYLVGGGVRDILLGLSPKDFDIATDATPEQVAKQFKNCRLIGRRFRLAHILFGREIIEVATFRASHQDSNVNKAKVSAQGMLVRDNVYGSLEEDAVRRDFTINALYYSAEDFTVIDFVGGIEDLEKRQLRLIGEPRARYTEDPVRILRAIRLSAKLELSIESETAAPIKEMSSLLEHVSPARLWDETNKLLLSGHAFSTWQLLVDTKVAPHLFAQTSTALQSNEREFVQFIEKALKNTDRRIAQQQPVTPAFLYAVFLWKPLQDLIQKFLDKGMPKHEAVQKAVNRTIEQQCRQIAIPKRFSMVMRDMWGLQNRLFIRKKKSVDSLIQHPKFRAAYDFLCLRAGDDPELKALAKWWTDFQEAEPEQRIKMLKQAGPQHKGKKQGRSKFKRRPNKASNPNS